MAVLDIVSKKLGNSRAVCKKYYVHPGLITLYEERKLVKYLSELDAAAASSDKIVLSAEEEVLMKILRQYIRTA